MRPNNQNKRSRGRNSGGGRKHSNPLSRNFESNGPDVKIRGNASHIAEKYVQLARDAQSMGDSVMAENYLQHAEHYFRIVSAAQAQNPPQRTEQVQQSQNSDSDDEDDDNAQQSAPAKQVEAEKSTSAETPVDADSASDAQPAGAESEAAPRKPRERRPRRKPVQRDDVAKDADSDSEPSGELPAFLTNGQTTAAE